MTGGGLMEILGIQANPYQLFLILILLMAATGSFDPKSLKTVLKEDLKIMPAAGKFKHPSF
jgi:hypothetical protein